MTDTTAPVARRRDQRARSGDRDFGLAVLGYRDQPMVVIDATIVTTAPPHIQRGAGLFRRRSPAGSDRARVTSAVLVLLGVGRRRDRIGRARPCGLGDQQRQDQLLQASTHP